MERAGFLHHGVQDNKQLSGEGGQDRLFGFSGCFEFCGEVLKSPVLGGMPGS
jgi:hypothetical protein